MLVLESGGPSLNLASVTYKVYEFGESLYFP